MNINANSGALNWTPTESQGPSTNQVVVKVTDSNTNAVNTQQFSVTNSFVLVVNEVNLPPALLLPPTQTIDELTLLNAFASATDFDLPANALTFGLVSGPGGLTVSPTGAINWTPTEAQGPSTNTVSVRVTDNNPSAVNAQQLSVTNSFQVIVREVNEVPALPVIADRTINELTLLTVTNTATDSDLPANTFTYQLLSAPANASVSPNGVITWTPTEAQGPSTNVFMTKVTDNGTPPLSATNNFTIIVNEVNAAPVLTLPANQTLDELVAFSANATATDSDVPTNSLTIELLSGPSGLTLSPTGAIAWTPPESQGPSTNTVLIRAFDNGSPSLSSTQNFTLTVREVNTAPALAAIPDQLVPVGTNLSLSVTATDPDVPTNTLTFSLVTKPATATIEASTGLFSWTPAGGDAGTTNTITVRVADNGSPGLSDMKTFTIFVAPPLQITSVTRDATRVTLIWGATTGKIYRVQYKNDLNQATWSDLTGDVTATGLSATKEDTTIGGIQQRFYRIQLLP